MGDCKERVHDVHGASLHQCTRKATRDGYCYQHHPDAVEKRRKESDRAYHKRMERDPFTLFMRCQKRCAEVESVLRKFVEHSVQCSCETAPCLAALREEAMRILDAKK